MKKIVKQRAKKIQKVFENKKNLYKIIQECSHEVIIRQALAEVFVENFIGRKKQIEERYYFQAFNGCYEKTFRENGLGNISGLNENVVNAFKLLEDELGKTDMSNSDENVGITTNFFTTDPFTLMRYALTYSPERLWLGPLGVDIVDGVKEPVKIGETKIEYMMRIIEKRLPKHIDEERKQKIFEAGKIIAEEFGSKRPIIAIIPESEISEYDANFSGKYTMPRDKVKTLADQENMLWTYNMQSGPNFSSSQGIAVYGDIDSSKFVTLSIPDMFELIQILGIEKGAQLGDLIDPKKGEVIERAKTTQMIVKNENKKTEIFSKLKRLIKKEHSEANVSSDYGTIKLEETGEENLCEGKAEKSLTELKDEEEMLTNQIKINSDEIKKDIGGYTHEI